MANVTEEWDTERAVEHLAEQGVMILPCQLVADIEEIIWRLARNEHVCPFEAELVEERLNALPWFRNNIQQVVN